MNAKEYYCKWAGIPNKVLRIDDINIIALMEEYHKAKLSEITKEEIAIKIVDEIAYKQHHEDQGDDYIERFGK